MGQSLIIRLYSYADHVYSQAASLLPAAIK